jgi:hypothetical protein
MSSPPPPYYFFLVFFLLIFCRFCFQEHEEEKQQAIAVALERADALRDRVVAEERETALKVPYPLPPHISVYTIYYILYICPQHQ